MTFKGLSLKSPVINFLWVTASYQATSIYTRLRVTRSDCLELSRLQVGRFNGSRRLSLLQNLIPELLLSLRSPWRPIVFF